MICSIGLRLWVSRRATRLCRDRARASGTTSRPMRGSTNHDIGFHCIRWGLNDDDLARAEQTSDIANERVASSLTPPPAFGTPQASPWLRPSEQRALLCSSSSVTGMGVASVDQGMAPKRNRISNASGAGLVFRLRARLVNSAGPTNAPAGTGPRQRECFARKEFGSWPTSVGLPSMAK